MEKVNPYNQNNKLVTENDIINIMETLNINDFKINNILLYQRSFVHTSYCHELYKDKEGQPLFANIDDSLDLQEISYETMEFLGDSFLGNIIANYLYQRYVNYFNIDEGFLTKLKIRFVCGEQLAYLSNSLNLNQFMIISKHILHNLSIVYKIYEQMLVDKKINY